MIRTVIIEDERIIADELARLLTACSGEIWIEAHLKSIRDAIDYFSVTPKPDLVFADVQLPDGLPLKFSIGSTSGVPLFLLPLTTNT